MKATLRDRIADFERGPGSAWALDLDDVDERKLSRPISQDDWDWFVTHRTLGPAVSRPGETRDERAHGLETAQSTGANPPRPGLTRGDLSTASAFAAAFGVALVIVVIWAKLPGAEGMESLFGWFLLLTGGGLAVFGAVGTVHNARHQGEPTRTLSGVITELTARVDGGGDYPFSVRLCWVSVAGVSFRLAASLGSFLRIGDEASVVVQSGRLRYDRYSMPTNKWHWDPDLALSITIGTAPGAVPIMELLDQSSGGGGF